MDFCTEQMHFRTSLECFGSPRMQSCSQIVSIQRYLNVCLGLYQNSNPTSHMITEFKHVLMGGRAAIWLQVTFIVYNFAHKRYVIILSISVILFQI